MPRIAVPIALLALVSSLALAACGGGSSDKPTKAEYITKADAICKAGNGEINAAVAKQFGNKQPTEAQVTAFTHDVVIPRLEKESTDLKALDKPDGDDDELNAIYSSLDKAIEMAKNTDGTIDDASFNDADAKARAYGLKTCGAEN